MVHVCVNICALLSTTMQRGCMLLVVVDQRVRIVDRLILDSTSAKDLRLSSSHRGKMPAQHMPVAPIDRVRDIVVQRGKMHNPTTNSGGVLLGTVVAVGAQSPLPLRVGDRVVPLASLTCIPLHLDKGERSLACLVVHA